MAYRLKDGGSDEHNKPQKTETRALNVQLKMLVYAFILLFINNRSMLLLF